MTHLCVPEWGKVPVGRAGGFTVAQAEALVAAARAHPLGGADGAGILTDHRHHLQVRQMVGVLAAQGCSLEILPKIDRDTLAEDAPTVRQRLIALLDLTLGLNLGEGAAASIARGADSLLDILIRIFADRLLAETRRGLPRLYKGCEEDLPTLRGRLDVTRQFTVHAARADRLACRYDMLSHDIALMQVMASSVVFLRKHARAPETQRLLDELRFVLADITLLPPGRLPWKQIRIDRSNRRWESLLDLAALLLRRDWQATTHDPAAREGLTLLFPMEKLFEAAVAALLARALAGSGLEIAAQGGLQRILGDWDSEIPCEGRHFSTMPDILLKQGGQVVAVIDAKWKRLAANPLDRERGVSQADIYQMMAYARLYRCQRLMLLYPATPGTGSKEARRFGIHGAHEMLSLARIDFGQSTDGIRKDLKTLMSGFLALHAGA